MDLISSEASKKGHDLGVNLKVLLTMEEETAQGFCGISWPPHSPGNPLQTNRLSVDISRGSSYTDSDPPIEPEE